MTSGQPPKTGLAVNRPFPGFIKGISKGGGRAVSDNKHPSVLGCFHLLF
jgi:hypothetical protein